MGILEISHILSREELVGLANIRYGNVNMFKTILNNKVVLVYILTFPFWKRKKIVFVNYASLSSSLVFTVVIRTSIDQNEYKNHTEWPLKNYLNKQTL